MYKRILVPIDLAALSQQHGIASALGDIALIEWLNEHAKELSGSAVNVDSARPSPTPQHHLASIHTAATRYGRSRYASRRFSPDSAKVVYNVSGVHSLRRTLMDFHPHGHRY
jgi:hypothetical protein